MEQINCQIIVCGPAVGKSYLASIDQRFYDLDGEKAKYKYGLFDVTPEKFESGKLNRGTIVNYDSNEWAIQKLEEELKNNRIILLSFNNTLINYLQKNNLPFCLVYPSIDSNEEYAMRMKKRKNSEKFIKEMTDKDKWISFYKENISNSQAKYKIELEKGKYLSDIKELFLKK